MKLVFKPIFGSSAPVSKAKTAPVARITKAGASLASAINEIDPARRSGDPARIAKAIEASKAAFRQFHALGGTIRYSVKKAAPATILGKASGELYWPPDLAAEGGDRGIC